MKRKYVENGQQQTCLAIRNGLLSFFLLHTKALSANNQYVPLRQDELTWQSENVSLAEEKL